MELDPTPCTLCGQPARLYPFGWRCSSCAPVMPVPDPELTAEALARRELTAVYPQPLEYGHGAP